MDTTKNAYLDKVTDKLVGETGIDYEKNAVYNSSLFVSPTHPLL